MKDMDTPLHDLEHIPGLSEVDAYVRKHTNIRSLDLTQLEGAVPSVEASLSAENILMLDLDQVRAHGPETLPTREAGIGQASLESPRPSTLGDLRGYIRAVSWMTHKQPAEGAAPHATGAWRERLGLPADAVSDERIQQAFTSLACGEEAETAVRDIEALMTAAWKEYRAAAHDADRRLKAVELILMMRPMRDQIYYQREYPNLCRVAAQKP